MEEAKVEENLQFLENAETSDVPLIPRKNCKFCKGSGKIELIFSLVDCECLEPAPKNPRSLRKPPSPPRDPYCRWRKEDNRKCEIWDKACDIVKESKFTERIIEKISEVNGGELARIDTSRGDVVINAPRSPSPGDRFGVKNMGKGIATINLPIGAPIPGPTITITSNTGPVVANPAPTQIPLNPHMATTWSFNGTTWELIE